MQNALTKGALPIYARLLADSCGVDVRFGGAVAYTNGQTITLPDLPMDDPDSKALAFGLIMHEAGHITETSFADIPTEPVRKHIFNLLEDVRMEACQGRKYAGARQRLALMTEALIKTGYFGSPRAEASPNELMSAMILYRLRESVLGQPSARAYADAAEALCRQKLPANMVTRLNMLMRQVTECKSTADALALTDEIIKMMEEEKEAPPPPSQDQQPNPAQDGQQDQAAGDSAQSAGSETSDASDASNASGDADDSGAGAGNGATDPEQQRDNLAAILSGADADGMGDVGDIVKKALGEISSATGYYEKVSPSMPTRRLVSGDRGEKLLDQVRAQSRALRRRLANHLEGVRQSARRVARTGLRLARNRLYRIETLNPRVFEKREQAVEVNTAVMLLIDRSGSMSGRIDMATLAALALYDALDGIHGVSCAVNAFPGVSGCGTSVYQLADFGQRPREQAGTFVNLGVEGGTPLAEAMMYAGVELSKRAETRKILFVCTDGDPNNPDACRKLLGMLAEEGIETMGLGIGIDIAHLYPTSARIDSIDDMSAAVFGLMQRQLLKAAA